MGVGSIVDAPTAGIYIANGAKFVVGPCSTPTSRRSATGARFPTAPAAARPAKSAFAEELGCEIVKVFPGSSVGGPDFVKSVLGPCRGRASCPPAASSRPKSRCASGSAPASSPAGIGSNLITKELLDASDYAGIEKRVRETVAAHQEDSRRTGREEVTTTERTMAELKIKPAAETRWDCVSFGEVMLRFDPGFGRVRNARSFTGMGRRRRVQRRPRHAQVLGQARRRRDRAAEERPRLAGRGLHHAGRRRHVARRSGAISTAWAATRASASTSPKRASASAPALGCSDRGHSAASQIRPGEVNWEKLFGEEGVRWFHTGGIFAALASNTSEAVIEAVEVAKQIRHRRLLRSQLPRLAVEEPGRQGRRAEGQPRDRQVRRRDDRQRGGLHRLPRLRGRGCRRAPDHDRPSPSTR